MEKSSIVFLTVSLALNFLLLGLVLVLWFIRCKSCNKDKEIRQVFKSCCEKCQNGKGKNGKKVYSEI